MQWEKITSVEFEKAVAEIGVCLLPAGVIERHSDHLPLGTDFLIAHKLCCLAAEKEPAVVFPPIFFGQIFEAACFPGTIAIKPDLLFETVNFILDEIGRNGFKKIIIVNSHGGNTHFLRYLAQCTLYEEKPYNVHVFFKNDPELKKKVLEIVRPDCSGHAGETETSLMMHAFPELVRTDKIPAEPAFPLNRLKDVSGTYTGIWWYADHPEHYAGDARIASAEKGHALFELYSDALADCIRKIKQDTKVEKLNKEFFERKRGL